MKLCDQNGGPVAITTSGSAASWQPEFVQKLLGKRVLIFSDSDQPGQRYASDVSASLDRCGIEHEVIDFTQYGNDVRDLIDLSPLYPEEELVRHVDSPWLRPGQPNPRPELRSTVPEGSLTEI